MKLDKYKYYLRDEMIMMPENFFEKLNKKLGKEGKLAFLSTFIIGILTHMVALTSDIPNHDGLEYMYTTHDNITSGRWFIKLATGISSYYSIPWFNAILGFIYLSAASVILVKLLKVKRTVFVVFIAAMLVTFPSIASNFAYAFTIDGYMLSVLLTVLSVYLVELNRFGFIWGGIALAFSMGIYQAYLPIAILLCLYKVLMVFAAGEKKVERTGIKRALKYLYMGIIGAGLYYVILKVLLAVQGKELDSYQGINNVGSARVGLVALLREMYVDFAGFSIKGHILFANGYALLAVILLTVTFVVCLFIAARNAGWLKKVWFYLIMLLLVVAVPLCTNIIMVVSPDVTYHLLMRYQWAFFGILAIAFINYTLENTESLKHENSKTGAVVSWATILAAFVICFSYIVSDNIAYSNLQKKYEKTYAYCLRLADRIEQTQGYYQGIPIYMIGVVGNDNFPVTDNTQKVTDHMLGLDGDWLLYTPANYEFFFKYFLGCTFNFIKPEEACYYYDEIYVNMPSFPDAGSTLVSDGILFVKTENVDYSLRGGLE